MQEIWCEGPHQWQLYGKKRTCESEKAFVVGVHGYSEHSGSYDHLAEFFLEHGVSSLFIDLPGHGRSSGQASNIDDFNDYLRSLSSLIAEARLPSSAILLGHSLGGLVSLRYIQSGDKRDLFRKLLLLSPLLGLAKNSFHRLGCFVQSDLGLGILEAVCRILPNIALPNKGAMENSVLTHDLEMAKKRSEDPLVREQVTVHWTREFLRARRQVFQGIDRIECPVAIFQAGDDRVVSRAQVERIAKLISNQLESLKIYEGLFHELVNETERAQVFEDILQVVLSERR